MSKNVRVDRAKRLKLLIKKKTLNFVGGKDMGVGRTSEAKRSLALNLHTY